MRRLRHKHQDDAELNITAFMNLMIVLVPVLLMNMVFSHITVLDLTLPDSATSPSTPEEDRQIELVVRSDELQIFYPRGFLLKRVLQKQVEAEPGEQLADPDAMQHDYKLLADILREVKRQLREKDIDKRDITILSQPDTDYQTIVSLMDAARSFKAVVAGSVVNSELFPEISRGDAPINNDPVQAVK